VHDWQAIAIVIFLGDHVVTENLSRTDKRTFRRDQAFVREVIIVAHHAVAPYVRAVFQKPVILFARETVVHQELKHFGAHLESVAQVE
jgi:hypothetical protein